MCYIIHCDNILIVFTVSSSVVFTLGDFHKKWMDVDKISVEREETMDKTKNVMTSLKALTKEDFAEHFVKMERTLRYKCLI